MATRRTEQCGSLCHERKCSRTASARPLVHAEPHEHTIHVHGGHIFIQSLGILHPIIWVRNVAPATLHGVMGHLGPSPRSRNNLRAILH